jgi:hypothetical protein
MYTHHDYDLVVPNVRLVGLLLFSFSFGYSRGLSSWLFPGRGEL